MCPAFDTGDHLAVKATKRQRPFNRNEVVIFKAKEALIKRIVAVEVSFYLSILFILTLHTGR